MKKVISVIIVIMVITALWSGISANANGDTATAENSVLDVVNEDCAEINANDNVNSAKNEQKQNFENIPATCTGNGKHNICTDSRPATCTANGCERIYCTHCDYFTTTIIPAKGHSYVVIESVPDTKHENGYDILECKECGKKAKQVHKHSAPAATKINTLEKGKKYFKVTWNLVNDVTGYQVQYAADNSFKSAKKTLTVKGSDSLKKTAKMIKDNTNCVRVRTYKVIGGKTYYSKWTAAKTV